MKKYEELKNRAEKYKNRLEYGIAYRDNLENNIIVSNTSSYQNAKGSTFKPFLSNRTSPSYGFIEADEFTEEEMDVLKALVRSHVERLKLLYDEAAVKLQAVEELLS